MNNGLMKTEMITNFNQSVSLLLEVKIKGNISSICCLDCGRTNGVAQVFKW